MLSTICLLLYHNIVVSSPRITADTTTSQLTSQPRHEIHWRFIMETLWWRTIVRFLFHYCYCNCCKINMQPLVYLLHYLSFNYYPHVPPIFWFLYFFTTDMLCHFHSLWSVFTTTPGKWPFICALHIMKTMSSAQLTSVMAHNLAALLEESLRVLHSKICSLIFLINSIASHYIIIGIHT